MDRSAAGLSDFTQYFAGRTTAPVQPTDGRVTLRVYVDSSSVEAFGADGRAAVTSLTFPPPDADGMSFYAKDGTAHVQSLKVDKDSHAISTRTATDLDLTTLVRLGGPEGGRRSGDRSG